MQKLIWQNANRDEINLTSGNYGITAWEGFSNTSLNIQSQQVPFQDGGVFLDALLEQRELSVTLAIYDGNNLETRYRLRRELIHILNPKLGEGYLIYTNDFTSKRIKCVPQIPLFETHNSNDSGTPKASLAWTACEPYWEDLEETEVVFSVGEFVNINNNGDTPSYLKIELSGSALNPKIQNMSTNKFIEYKNQLQNPIIINTNMGQKKITEEEISFYLSNSNKSISSIVYSSALGMFVAVGSGGVILTSNDGVKWTYQISGVTTNISDIVYAVDKNLFVAITGTSVLTSTDGINWTRTQVIAISFRSIFYSLDLEMFIKS